MLVDILAEYNLFASTHGHHTVSIGKLKADLEQHAPYIRFTKPQNLWRCHNVLLKKNVNPLDDDESTDD